LWGIVFVLIAYLGCIGNILVIIVLRKDPIMSTLTHLLIALAVSDILAPQANALLGFSFYHLSSKYGNSVTFLKFENILRYIIHPLSTMFTMSSSWIVTLTTLFRLIAVKYPFTARTLINKRKAVFSLIVIFGFSLASIIPLYTGLMLQNKCTRDNKYHYVAFEMKDFSEFMKKAYTPMMQIMCFYLPWTLSLIFWIFLLRSLKESSKNLQIQGSYTSSLAKKSPSTPSDSFKDTNSRMSNTDTRKRNTNRITLMVVVLCFTNLICRVFTFCFIFEVIFNEYLKQTSFLATIKDELAQQSESLNNQKDLLNSTSYHPHLVENAKTHFPLFLSYSLLLNNIFLCINHSSNIFIYTFTNPRFKKDLFSLFRPKFLNK